MPTYQPWKTNGPPISLPQVPLPSTFLVHNLSEPTLDPQLCSHSALLIVCKEMYCSAEEIEPLKMGQPHLVAVTTLGFKVPPKSDRGSTSLV
ncbi:hypothetical protein Trydic_g18531 [Trypoxylus dichotomus]